MNGLRRALRLLEELPRRILNKQFLLFLFFLALSASFWLFITLEEEYEQEFKFPLKVRNLPQNVVITTDLPSSLRVMLKDRGAMLLKYKYAASFSPVYIDFSNYSSNSGYIRLLTSDLLKQVSQQLERTTRIGTVKPDTIEFFFNYGRNKRVPVRIKGDISTDEHFVMSRIRIKPDSVTVYAISSVLDTITAAYTNSLYIRNISDTVALQANLQRVRGAKFEPNAVNIMLCVDQMTEKTVSVPVQWVNFPATKVLRTFPSRVNITFQVGMSNYRRIGAEQFVLVVNYAELLRNTTGKCHLQLKTIPQGASHVRISPSDVEFLIEDAPIEN